MHSEKTLKQKLNQTVTSVILAGGQGTRLHPLTLHRCKPAVSFGGRYRLIDVPISNSLNSQIQNIFVISQYFASSLQQHLSATYPHHQLAEGNLEMLCPEETEQGGVKWFKGTADAIRQTLPYLLQLPSDYYLILSGDQLYNIDLLNMVQFAQDFQADLVIASIPVQEREAKRMGLLRLRNDQSIVDFFEKPNTPALLQKFQLPHPDQPPRYLGSMGIYVFSRKALIELLQHPGDDFGKDLIPLMVQNKKSFAYIYEGYWEDIGTISSFYEANLALVKQENCLDIYNPWRPIYTANFHLPSPLIAHSHIDQSIINPGCVIHAQEISYSLVGMCCQIGLGSILRDSIILGNPGAHHIHSPLVIGKDCVIRKAIIDEEAELGDRVQLINEKNQLHYDGDGIFIRDGIIIVTSKTRLPNDYRL